MLSSIMEDTKLDMLLIKKSFKSKTLLCMGQQLINMKRKIEEMVNEQMDLLHSLESAKEFNVWQFSMLGKLGYKDRMHLNRVLKMNGIDRN